MPNKNIYVRESDVGLWEEAERLAGGSLSRLIADRLRDYVEGQKRVEQMKAEMQTEMEPIELALGGYTIPTRGVRFTGRWLVTPGDEMRSFEPGSDLEAYYCVAFTRRGKIAVYVAHVNGRFDATLDTYSSFEEAEEHGVPKDILAAARAEVDPDYVEELDI